MYFLAFFGKITISQPKRIQNKKKSSKQESEKAKIQNKTNKSKNVTEICGDVNSLFILTKISRLTIRTMVSKYKQ